MAPLLVCPQCHHDNSPLHHFCQQCGASLTLQTCQGCGVLVPFSLLHCPQCDRLTGQVLAVVLAETVPSAELSPDRPPGAVSSLSFPFEGDFLDVHQRYRLLGSSDDPLRGFQPSPSSPGQRCFQGTVLDCRPLHPSAFLPLLQTLATRSADLPVEMPVELSDQPSDQPLDQPVNPWLVMPEEIPTIAHPYVHLQATAQLPSLPMPYDAWQVGSWEVLLLPDRSHWQSLPGLIATQPLPMLQILYWFNEMVALWTVLEPMGLAQSLLIPANLRVDEDQALGLCQLYVQGDDPLHQLKSLVQLWRDWLSNSGQEDAIASIAALVQVCDRILSADNPTQEALRTQLQQLADREQRLIPHFVPASISRDSLNDPVAASGESSGDPPDGSDTLSNTLKAVNPLEQNLSPELLMAIGEELRNDMATEILPMRLFSLSEAGATNCGQQREQNEDFLGIDSQITLQQNLQTRQVHTKGLYIVCDGMGGHAAGEVASALAVHTLRDYFQKQWPAEGLPTEEVIKAGIWQANQALYRINQQNASMGLHRMGTTLVMLLLRDNHVAIAHVGDSRIYRVNRKWGLEQLTVDHSVGQEAIKSGLEPTLAFARPNAHKLTQALGPLDDDAVLPSIQYLDIQEDTLFLLCSDGLSDNNLVEMQWETFLLPLLSSSTQLAQGIQPLIDFANQYNGHDNITAVLVRLKVRPHFKN